MLNSISSSKSPNEKQRPVRQVKLATRLTALILIVTVPLLIGVNFYVATQAGVLIEGQANVELSDATERVEDTLLTWLRLQSQALTGLASLPGMSSMDANQQKPILQAMAKAYPDFFLIHTLNLDGINIARSDDNAPLDYHDRQWFIRAKAGDPTTSEIVISRTIGKPVLAIGAPIKDSSGNIVGVAAVVSILDTMNHTIDTAIIGKTGYVYVIDSKNQVVIHPAKTLASNDKLIDLSAYPPVVALRQGNQGIVNFTDENGKQWRAFIIILDNNWAVITQEPLDELLAPLHLFQGIAVAVSTAGILLLLVLAWLAIWRTLRPIGRLTETVEAITAGDINRTVDVSSQDEIGTLASAFNTMTAQLRDFINNLELRVQERTAELEDANEQNANRSQQLHSIAQITRAVSSIQNIDELLPEIAKQISAVLGFYHVGIFLNDQSGEYAVLQASNSEGGRKMIERSHRLKINQLSIVGFVTSTGLPRIALDVGDDAIFFSDNSDLVDTHSEIALPLHIGENIIGVLDLQSSEPNAFSGKDIDTLTLLADQVSIAIQNNLSFDETRTALAQSEGFYGQSAVTGWQEILHQGKTGYRYINGGIETLNDPIESSMADLPLIDNDNRLVNIPIMIRGKKLGIITIRQPGRDHAWDENEMRTLQSIVDRLSFALENARLYQDAQKRASKERIVGEITTKIRSANDPNEMIRVAIDELKSALNLNDVRIVPYDPPKNGAGHKEE